MRHRGRHVGLAQFVVVLWLLRAFTCAFAAGQFHEAASRQPRADAGRSPSDPDGSVRDSRAPNDSGLHLELGVRRAHYLDLNEPYQFNPVAGLLTPIATGWERRWYDDRVWLQARYDVRAGDHLLLQPGLVLGAARGRFAAENAGIGFSEEWLTKPALLGGLTLAAELHAAPAQGPFLMVRYLFSSAEAGEENETIISNRQTHPENRDARFRWQESEAILGLGCRWGAFRPMVGLAHTDVHLKKWLRYHIPEENVSGFELEVIRGLNSEESEYRYENENPWALFLELGWQVTPTAAFVARGGLNGGDDYSVGLRVDY